MHLLFHGKNHTDFLGNPIQARSLTRDENVVLSCDLEFIATTTREEAQLPKSWEPNTQGPFSGWTGLCHVSQLSPPMLKKKKGGSRPHP